jgi:hypothetical protein
MSTSKDPLNFAPDKESPQPGTATPISFEDSFPEHVLRGDNDPQPSNDPSQFAVPGEVAAGTSGLGPSGKPKAGR